VYTDARPGTRPRRVWLRVFLTGLALWLVSVITTFLTGNPNLIPTVVLLGSFLVPVTFVVWAWQRQDSGEVTPSLLFSTFVTGGILGVIGASVLETYLLRPSWWLFLGVGLIEEAVKLGALAVLTRRLEVKSVRDGMLLGAATGFGFAAFESAGYAFTALFTADGLSLSQLVETEVLRGLLAPVGHGLWTAILGGVLFGASDRRAFTVTGRLVLSYLGVSLLHGLWDWMHSLAIRLTLILTEGERYVPTPNGWIVKPTAEQARLLPIIEWSGLGVLALIGIGWLIAEWRWARRASPTRRSFWPAWQVPIHRV
jgi:RsiW-degrading membrane proteinase PrsW (M82 family)